MKVLVSLFGLWLALGTAYVQAGEGGSTSDAGNGGFAYRRAVRLVRSAIQELNERINCLSQALLDRYGIDPGILADALHPDSIRFLSAQERSRGDQALEMDYRIHPSCQIELLRPLFATIESRLEAQDLQIMAEVAEKLLHEAGHCFGLDERRAALWAQQASDMVGLGRVPLYVMTRGFEYWPSEITINGNERPLYLGEDRDQNFFSWLGDLRPGSVLDVRLAVTHWRGGGRGMPQAQFFVTTRRDVARWDRPEEVPGADRTYLLRDWWRITEFLQVGSSAAFWKYQGQRALTIPAPTCRVRR